MPTGGDITSETFLTPLTGLTPNMKVIVASLTNLPVELQECIIVQFARDPDTTFDQLKALRLVSRTFDVLCSRKCMSCIRLFRHGNSPLNNLRQLQGLLPSKHKSHHMDLPTTLIIENWRWVYGNNFFLSFREMRDGKSWVPGIIFNSTFLPLVYLLRFLLAPQVLPVGVFNSIMRFRARRRLSHATTLDLPNIRRVEWLAERDVSNWTTSCTMKLLLEFPQLTELSLVIDEEQDIGYFSKSLSKLHNLRKLSLNVRRRYPESFRPQIDEFGPVIAGNPMLTHLELFQSSFSQASLSRMFEQVPSNRPLALEHFGISDNFRDTDAILPHLGSLKSIHVRSSTSSAIFMLMLQQRIFPPVVETVRADSQFMDYISSHPIITSLSVHSLYDDIAGATILKTMARHCETLDYFSTCASSFCHCLGRVQNELLLLQCTHLRQLVLGYVYVYFYLGAERGVNVPSELEIGLTVISRMQRSLTLVLTDMAGFKVCVRMCQKSCNPLLRDLSGRIVYERPHPLG
ncbi:hypothetical protein JOM56_009933 [Amanita muscaria]